MYLILPTGHDDHRTKNLPQTASLDDASPHCQDEGVPFIKTSNPFVFPVEICHPENRNLEERGEGIVRCADGSA